MADLPGNRSRVVPIMAARKSNGDAPQPRVTRASNKKAADAEALRLPCLEQLGLYAFPTKGDGNCLYYALSDQLYGVWDRSAEIRSHLAQHMKTHRDYFVNFTAAVGGRRRAPRRAASAAARASTPVGPSASPQEQEEAFDAMVARSGKDGVWGGSEEIQAFCQFYKRDVKVYTDSGIQTFRDVNAPPDEERELVHIAFHNFNHYSSVRNINGPHTGLPCVKPTGEFKPDAGQASSESGLVIDVASPWKISCIQEGLGGRYDHNTIVEMLRQCRGDIDRAFSKLLDEETSASSSQSSQASATASTVSKSAASVPGLKPRLPSSRSSSRHSTASKRSADDDSDDEGGQRGRRTRGREQKRRILPNVTVGIAFRDEEKNDLVSLRLRVNPDAMAEQAKDIPEGGDGGDAADGSDPPAGRKLRARKPKQKQPAKRRVKESPACVHSSAGCMSVKQVE